MHSNGICFYIKEENHLFELGMHLSRKFYFDYKKGYTYKDYNKLYNNWICIYIYVSSHCVANKLIISIFNYFFVNLLFLTLRFCNILLTYDADRCVFATMVFTI